MWIWGVYKIDAPSEYVPGLILFLSLVREALIGADAKEHSVHLFEEKDQIKK